MKIARYLFQQLFTCAFESVHFYHGIINPQIVELLFDDNKLNIPLQIHSECSYIYNYANSLLLKSLFNHMLSNDFIIVGFANDQTLKTLFKVVTNGGNKFNRVYFNEYDYPKLYDFIIKHIEIGDVSKMVRKLIFRVTQKPIISKNAKNIKIKVENNNLKCTKYQLSNKWDPEMKFCIYNREYIDALRPGFDVEIKRINC
ncbi:unnamed protein product [Meloidogyne enterolobii]|uniref:Uncharacterized protein n=1 Tax=Meloidogyne enterolobii TaxID=390850 RepID=A0ACB0YGZ5_MELEN